MSDSIGRASNRIFFNIDGELRCGLRVLAFFLLFLVCASGLASLKALLGSLVPGFASLLGANPGISATELLVGSLINTITLLAAVVAAATLCARFLERRSLASVGYKLHRGWWRDFGIGFMLGAATLGISVAIAAAAGSLSFRLQTREAGSLAASSAFLVLFFLLAAAFEELLARGFVFQAIASALGPAAAITITSVGFAMLHLPNPDINLVGLVNTATAGVWLGAAYWMTRSLWLATALHMAWNFTMAFVFGLPVSGLTDFAAFALMTGEARSPVWVSGGAYGPEGGAAATAALVVSTLVIWRSGWFSPSTEMLAALRHRSLDSEQHETKATE